jgi:hypothetical protein
MEPVVIIIGLLIYFAFFKKKVNKKMTSCKSCEGSISIEADVCPHCGQPAPVQRSASCFVVTAVYGDINHPVVQDFRFFRDNTLVSYSLGKLFIKIYYKLGPYLANFISKHKSLIKITQLIFIKPIHLLIKRKSHKHTS